MMARKSALSTLRDKKGIIRILEAIIAAVIILGFLAFIILPRYTVRVPLEDEVYKIEDSILEAIEKTPDLREKVFSFSNPEPLKTFVSSELQSRGLKGSVVVCGIRDFCRIPQEELNAAGSKEIFVRDRVISVTLSQPQVEPKKVVVYAWIGQ